MADNLAIAVPRSRNADFQESEWLARRQIGIGQYYPQSVNARGYWQFESTWGGPVALNDVLLKARGKIEAVRKPLDIPCDELEMYEACAWNDTLVCALAQLLLWIHPAPLQSVGDREGAWQYYLAQWRPGAPHRHPWDARYAAARAVIGV